MEYLILMFIASLILGIIIGLAMREECRDWKIKRKIPIFKIIKHASGYEVYVKKYYFAKWSHLTYHSCKSEEEAQELCRRYIRDSEIKVIKFIPESPLSKALRKE